MTVIYAADVGSVEGKNFAWVRKEGQQYFTDKEVSDIPVMDSLLQCIVQDFDVGKKVSLGFECPLFIPVQSVEAFHSFTKGREGESRRPWSGGGLVRLFLRAVWLNMCGYFNVCLV